MKQFRKRIVLYTYVTLGVFLFEIIFPATASALTGGPTTPEVQSFTPIGTSDMVDVFSGDFKYNIPLLEVDGYPVNISYSGGINMDQEASWVGLGWNLNPGTVTRNMRGIPDDFKGDEIQKEIKLKDNISFGLSVAKNWEIFGKEKKEASGDTKTDGTQDSAVTKRISAGFNLKLGLIYNNYDGTSLDVSTGIDASILKATAPKIASGINFGYTGSSGLTLSANASFDYKATESEEEVMGIKGNTTTSVNSRAGMKALNFGWSFYYSGLMETSRKNSDQKKTDKVRYNNSGGSAILFGQQTFTPTISIPMSNISVSLSYNIGKEIKGFTHNRTANGFVSIQKVKDNQITKKAFGYMNLEDAGWDDMMDFNREKDKPFSENSNNLPIPVPTYDIYSVTGQGISGTFRLYRNDNVYSREETNENFSASTGVGADFAGLDKFKGGLNLSFVQTKTYTGNIHTGNNLQERAKYVGKGDLSGTPLYEPAYFRQMGEPTRSNVETHPGLMGYSLLTPIVGFDYTAPNYVAHVGSYEPLSTKVVKKLSATPTDNIQTLRQPRNLVMQGLTALQAKRFGLDNMISYYSLGQTTPSNGMLKPNMAVQRMSDYRKAHHLSEMRVYSGDGSIYVYGLPAYNITQEEISFAIGSGNCATGMGSYSSQDISSSRKSGNENGRDHFVQKIKTPAYVYAHHLTGILSPDYVDLTGDGISDDDLGTAVRFDYQLVASNYKWRTPYLENTAMYNEGRKTDALDDRGSIIYGEKEVYCLHSIVGKNHIAIFYVSLRNDAVGVADIHGGDGTDGDYLYQLDSIVLYNKQDFYQNGTNAYKIKAVHLEYDYSLCGSVENFNSFYSGTYPYMGKLTLKKIWFTYGNSFKGKLSPYKFNYNFEENSAYNYHVKGHDRWGSFLPAGTVSCGSTTALSTAEFPFTPQHQTLADNYAGAWSLSEIILPSGGRIQIEYEADDYGYVQDRRAMTMLKIQGFGNDTAFDDITNLLYTKKGKDVINNYVFFDLGGVTTQEQLKRMVEGISLLQFTVFVDINGNGEYEFVKGYAEVDTDNPDYYGLTNDNYSAFIRLKTVTLRDKGKGGPASPISMNVWNWSRIHAAELVYNQKVSDNPTAAQAFKGFYEIIGMFNELISLAQGINGNLKSRGFAQKVNVNKSFVRIQARDTKKLGGGHRVKRITINDHWAYIGAANTTANDFEYGQEYDYTTTETDAIGQTYTISSGVASYEPGVGSDENPFVMPRYERDELLMVPDIMYMDDSPLGESFMPAAQVGYSKVTVKALSHTGVARTATGKQVYEFYTARDFPVIYQETKPAIMVLNPNPIVQFFNIDRLEETKVAASQGYKVEVNDMHGKPKAQYTYSESSETPIGGVMYEYFTDPDDRKRLSNTIQVVSMSGVIQEKDLATEVDVQTDYRQSYNEVQSASVNVNADFFTLAAFPLLIPSVYNSYKKTTQKIQSAVTCKVISRYGIVKSTTAIKEGSQITTRNLLFDEITGSVLVSSVQNEFDHDIYSVTTPAHWAYDEGMGPAYKNIGMKVSFVTFGSDTILFPSGLSPRDFLVPGDEVYVMDMFNGNGYPCHVYEGENYRLNLIEKRSGSEFKPNIGHVYSIEVVRPGRKNLAGIPIQQMSMVTNPMATGTLAIDSVISAAAVEYGQYWPYYCSRYYQFTCDTIDKLPLPEIQEFLDDVFDNLSVADAGINIDTECLLDRLAGYGYKSSSLDSVFKKQVSEGFTIYTLLESTAPCINCNDSLFIKLAEGVYKGFGTQDLLQCQDLEENACESTYPSVISQVPYSSLYETYRYLLDSIAGNCVADTALNVSLVNGSVYQNNGDLLFNFARCDKECDLRIEIPDRYCYKAIHGVLDISYYTNETFSVSLSVELPDGTMDTLETFGSADCVALRIIDCSSECLVANENTTLNPYFYGILGNWRMKRQYAFVENRAYSATPNPAKDGTYSDFSPFWSYHAPSGKMVPSTSSNWVWANQVTKYSPHGNEIENQDALGRYSAALFGFNYTLPIAVAGNSKYEQLAYESFEENSNFWVMANCYDGHFNFAGYIPDQAELTTQYAHTGKYSLRVKASQTVSSANDRTFCSDTTDPFGATEMNWRNCYCVGKFNPDTGLYVLSGWIKEGVDMLDTTYANASIQVKLHKIGSVTETYTFKGKGQIVDGWQRAFGEFRISDSVEQVEIILVGVSGVDSWFDDIRVQPFNSNMKTYAYDQVTLRLMAELDENNFATFYEYDQEGALVRVKKETVIGIVTLKEVRKSILKEN